MLQRAASNAYSWWWASHIRTKQSKWLEQSLQDMEDKVQSMLRLIEEDGDSFAKRAEMYYKRRPELITSVEEAYKAFRALADRYDILSKELQNANHTIATVFPEQVQFGMSDDEDDDSSRPTSNIPKNPNLAPKVPKAPTKDLKKIISTAAKQFRVKRSLKVEKPKKTDKHAKKSGLNKDEALEEIKKIQKEILALQTVKEFVKSAYESGVAKYWGIENKIMEKQQKVSSLQDEFNMDTVIEDDEARTLMAEAALKSCQETLAMLEEKQEKSTREAKEEYERIEAACQRLRFLREKYALEKNDGEGSTEGDTNVMIMGDESRSLGGDVVDLIIEEDETEKTKEDSDLGSISCLTVSQLAERIDQLVNKVIGLETAVSSQTVLVNTLRTETDDLNAEIRNLEEEKENLKDDTRNLSTRVKVMEGKLSKIQDLNKNVESQNSNLQTNFAKARSNLDHLSEKLSSVKPDDEEIKDPEHEGEKSISRKEEMEDVIKEVDVDVELSNDHPSVPKQEVTKSLRKSGTFLDRLPKEQIVEDEEDIEEINWQQMLLSGMEDREKILLKEYTTILRNYKEMKKKLSDREKKERDTQFDITVEIRGMKKSIQKRDEEIQYLRQRLSFLQADKNVKEDEDIIDNNNIPPTTIEDDEIKSIFIDRTPSISRVEEKLRTDIDAILDENLDFWLRFSTAFHQIQKFKTEVQDLQDEITKLKEKKRKPDGSVTTQIKSEARPIYKHLREIQRELNLWLEQSVSLKDELKGRFSSLCIIQEDITRALKEGVEEDEIKFSSHQAAKFHGEILNMKQENNKVREELQAGLDHVRLLQLEIAKTLTKMNEEFGILSDQTENSNRPRVPLRSFIFGTKPKKQKNSIFSCMHPNRRYQILKAGMRLSYH